MKYNFKKNSKLFIVFPRYCRLCGNAFYLQKVPIVKGIVCCPDCAEKGFNNYFYQLLKYKENAL